MAVAVELQGAFTFGRALDFMAEVLQEPRSYAQNRGLVMLSLPE